MTDSHQTNLPIAIFAFQSIKYNVLEWYGMLGVIGLYLNWPLCQKCWRKVWRSVLWPECKLKWLFWLLCMKRLYCSSLHLGSVSHTHTQTHTETLSYHILILTFSHDTRCVILNSLLGEVEWRKEGEKTVQRERLEGNSQRPLSVRSSRGGSSLSSEWLTAGMLQQQMLSDTANN